MKKVLAFLGILGISGMFVVSVFAASYTPVTATINYPSNVAFNTNGNGIGGTMCYYSGNSALSPNIGSDSVGGGVFSHDSTIAPDTAPTYWLLDPAASCTGATYGAEVSSAIAEGSYSYPFALNNTGNTTMYYGTELGNLQSMLYTNIPLVLEIGFALIGLGIAIHYVLKWVGRKA